MNEFTIDADRVVDFLAALMAQLAGPQTRYDNFSINLPGPALDPDWLSALEKRGIVKR